MGKRPRLLIIALAAAVALAAAIPVSAEDIHPRVISLYAGHTEVLLRLGARDNIIGVSAQESYQGPEVEGWKKPQVFSVHDDVEKFFSARPDIVLLRPQHMASGSRLVGTLEKSGIKVISLQVLRAEDLYQYWRDLAELVNRKDEAERLIADFDQRVSAYREAAGRIPEEAKPGVFIEAIHGRVKTFTTDSIPIWLLELAGGRNVAADAKPTAPGLMVADYGPERLLSKADEVDIFISQEGVMNPGTLKQLKARDIYRPLKAFVTGRVYKIDESILSRPTPSLLEGLAQIAVWTGLNLSETEGAGPAPENLTAPVEEPAGTAEPTDLEQIKLKIDLPPEN